MICRPLASLPRMRSMRKRQRLSGMAEIVEDRLAEQFVGHTPLNASQIPFCIGLPGVMKRQAIRRSCAHASMALEVNSVPWSG